MTSQKVIHRETRRGCTVKLFKLDGVHGARYLVTTRSRDYEKVLPLPDLPVQALRQGFIDAGMEGFARALRG